MEKINITERLQLLKDNNYKGVIIETGAGSPLYAELCDRPNTASKLVYYAFSPTSWELTKYKYQIQDPNQRAVSKETCHDILKKVINRYEEVNYVFCNSIQIGNDETIQTHGWIGMSVKSNYNHWITKYYHFTIDNTPRNKNRKELVTLIREICLDVFINFEEPTSGYIDMIFDEIISNNTSPINARPAIKELLQQKLYNTIAEHHADDVYICFKQGKLIRFNDALREAPENIILYKGSFNPIHSEHIELANYAKNNIANSEIWLMISVANRDPNKTVDVNNLIKRINMITDLGFNVIINTQGLYFYSNLYFKDHPDMQDKNLYQLMGDDTLKRLIDDEGYDLSQQFRNITILVRKRKYDEKFWSKSIDIKYFDKSPLDISSTNIRDLIQSNNIEQIIKEHGEEYFKILQKHFIE